eukprot:Anaeramoba_flamelloidesa1054084_71.p1 GENE.a1054084_71~~a1054084_71.p1  ORF type:complete len:524 (+),score=99.78 a1054084_71:879-2450(+)
MRFGVIVFNETGVIDYIDFTTARAVYNYFHKDRSKPSMFMRKSFDCVSALTKASELSWLSPVRLLLMITDHPCDESEFTRKKNQRYFTLWRDSDTLIQPKYGIALDELLYLGISFYFIKLHKSTDTMMKKFKEYYNRLGSQNFTFTVWDFSAKKIHKNIIQHILTGIQNSTEQAIDRCTQQGDLNYYASKQKRIKKMDYDRKKEYFLKAEKIELCALNLTTPQDLYEKKRPKRLETNPSIVKISQFPIGIDSHCFLYHIIEQNNGFHWIGKRFIYQDKYEEEEMKKKEIKNQKGDKNNNNNANNNNHGNTKQNEIYRQLTSFERYLEALWENTIAHKISIDYNTRKPVSPVNIPCVYLGRVLHRTKMILFLIQPYVKQEVNSQIVPIELEDKDTSFFTLNSLDLSKNNLMVICKYGIHHFITKFQIISNTRTRKWYLDEQFRGIREKIENFTKNTLTLNDNQERPETFSVLCDNVHCGNIITVESQEYVYGDGNLCKNCKMVGDEESDDEVEQSGIWYKKKKR